MWPAPEREEVDGGKKEMGKLRGELKHSLGASDWDPYLSSLCHSLPVISGASSPHDFETLWV